MEPQARLVQHLDALANKLDPMLLQDGIEVG
jgi:hypothetical protein